LNQEHLQKAEQPVAQEPLKTLGVEEKVLSPSKKCFDCVKRRTILPGSLCELCFKKELSYVILSFLKRQLLATPLRKQRRAKKDARESRVTWNQERRRSPKLYPEMPLQMTKWAIPNQGMIAILVDLEKASINAKIAALNVGLQELGPKVAGSYPEDDNIWSLWICHETTQGELQ
jgi:hypothetical protein